MTKIHINPETGQPGKCSAKIQCEFAINGQEPEHYATMAEARHAYEKTQAQKNIKSSRTKTTKNKKDITKHGLIWWGTYDNSELISV